MELCCPFLPFIGLAYRVLSPISPVAMLAVHVNQHVSPQTHVLAV